MSDEAATTERMLAFVRAVLAFATLIVAVKLYFEVQFEYRPMALTLELALSYALAMSLVTRHRPLATRRAAIFSSIFEVALITVLVASTGGSKSPFYLWYVFYIVSVSLRYGLQISIVALAASIVSYTIVTTSAVSLSLAGETFIPTFLGSTGFLFILALVFGHMSEKQKSYQAQLAVVNELGIALSSLSGSAEIEKELARQAATLLQAERGWFASRRDRASGGTLYWIGEDHPSGDADLGEWAPDLVIGHGRARITNDAPRDGSLPSDFAQSQRIRSIAAAPLLAPEAVVGVLYAVNRNTGPFSASDLRLLDLIASQAAPLLENARLAERLRETAASEERLRIARDLHDNFLQTLAAIKLHLERCSLLVDKNADKAKAAIGRTQEIAAAGLSEVRSYLSELRMVGPEPGQLREAIRRFTAEAAAAGGFNARLELDLDPDLISESACSAVFQILRELVNNAAKHAKAANLDVSAHASAEALTLRVHDDGAGFDVEEARSAAAATGHLGLVGVEERVNALQGEVKVQSAPGTGTTVTVRLPR
ncbi:MAG: histidine kinase [Armatimonadota bacterium]|nr:histidine kinase [Armatimonadota bacterium]